MQTYFENQKVLIERDYGFELRFEISYYSL